MCFNCLHHGDASLELSVLTIVHCFSPGYTKRGLDAANIMFLQFAGLTCFVMGLTCISAFLSDILHNSAIAIDPELAGQGLNLGMGWVLVLAPVMGALFANALGLVRLATTVKNQP